MGAKICNLSWFPVSGKYLSQVRGYRHKAGELTALMLAHPAVLKPSKENLQQPEEGDPSSGRTEALIAFIVSPASLPKNLEHKTMKHVLKK